MSLTTPIIKLGSVSQESVGNDTSYAGGAQTSQAVTGSFTATPVQMFGNAGDTFLILTGTPGAGFNVTTPTAQLLIQQLTTLLGFVPPVGFSFSFEMANQSNQQATLVGGTGVTVTGTATVAATSNRQWIATITNNTFAGAAVTFTNVGSRTN